MMCGKFGLVSLFGCSLVVVRRVWYGGGRIEIE